MIFFAYSDFLKKITIQWYRDGITTEGIEDQNEDDILCETIEFIEHNVDDDNNDELK